MKFFLTTMFLLILSATIAMASTLNINTATTAQLETLSGIGATKAQTIVAYRDHNGLFETVDDLTQVKGIGSKTVEKLRNEITVKDE